MRKDLQAGVIIVPYFRWEIFPTFSDEITAFPAKLVKPINFYNNDDVSLPKYDKYFGLVENLLHPIRFKYMWVVTRHHYGIAAALFSQTSFRGETSGGVAK